MQVFLRAYSTCNSIAGLKKIPNQQSYKLELHGYALLEFNCSTFVVAKTTDQTVIQDSTIL